MAEIYNLIKNNVSSTIVGNILGDSLYQGIQNYSDNIHLSREELADLLLKTLGNQVLSNQKFLSFFIKNVINDDATERICNLMKIRYTTRFESKENILKKSSSKIANAIVANYGLDKAYYLPSKSKKIECKEELLIEPDPRKYLALHDYQKRVKDQVTHKLITNRKARLLVHMPTGSGKTKTSIESIIDFLRTRPFDEGIVIWFAHSTELCQQAYQTLVDMWKVKGDYPLPVFRIFGDNDPVEDILNHKKAVIFMGFQKFASIKGSNKDINIKIKQHLSGKGSLTQLVVIDEAHKSLANEYEKAISYVSSMPNCRVLGLTATPGRTSNINDKANKNLAQFFGNDLIGITNENGETIKSPLKYLQEKEVLAEVELKPIKIEIDNLSVEELIELNKSGQLSDTSVEKIATSKLRNEIIIGEIQSALSNSEKDLILVFACSLNHCLILKKLLEFQSIESEVVLGSTPSDLREKYISDFKKEKLKVLINYGVLTTGFDAPKLKTLIIARPTNSVILYSQMLGRALRGPKNGGNKKNYVITLQDNIATMGDRADFLFEYWEDFWSN
jgi:DNA repair protein RadD